MNTTHKYSIKEEKNITHVIIEGDGDEVDAQSFVKDAELLFEKDRNKIHNAIIDMSKSGESDFEGLRVYQDFLKNEQLGKIAFIVDNRIIKMMIRVAIVSKKEDVGFFKDEKSARRWLSKKK